jgi:predicted TIM-barrel fold metal-dependent hydrolase
MQHRRDRTLIVDTHLHPLADDRARYPLAPGKEAPPADWYNQVVLTGADVLAQMDRAGVDGTVLVSAYNAYLYDSSYAADEALRYWVQQRGTRGVRLGEADPRVYPVCEEARRLGISVAFQVPQRAIGAVRAVAERYPDLPVILDHLAHPDLLSGPPYPDAAGFFALADCPNLHFKVTSMNIREAAEGASTPRAFLEMMLERFGSERMIWGSDFPHSQGSPTDPYKDLVDLAREAFGFFSDVEREQVFAGTALRLFPSLAQAKT